jgi:hypothetical protein
VPSILFFSSSPSSRPIFDSTHIHESTMITIDIVHVISQCSLRHTSHRRRVSGTPTTLDGLYVQPTDLSNGRVDDLGGRWDVAGVRWAAFCLAMIPVVVFSVGSIPCDRPRVLVFPSFFCFPHIHPSSGFWISPATSYLPHSRSCPGLHVPPSSERFSPSHFLRYCDECDPAMVYDVWSR